MTVQTLLLFCTLSAAAPPADLPKPAVPSSDEVAAAIRQLGDNRFNVREQATRRLWQAGIAAEPALRQALGHVDAEVVRRARGLLDKFDWGIYADTPPQIVTSIERYREGNPEAKHQAVSELVRAGAPGLAALAKIARHVTEKAERGTLGAALTDAARTIVPKLVRERDYAAAAALLEACLVGDLEEGRANYTAFVLLRGQLDAAIARWQAERPERPDVLAALFRAKGDAAAARKHAAASGQDALLDDILWEQGDWKELARRPTPEGLPPTTSLGTFALLHHFAGDTKALDANLTELRRQVRASEKWAPSANRAWTDEESLNEWAAAKTLLLVERPVAALALLDGLPALRTAQFDLLATQLRYREALAVAERSDPPEDAAASKLLRQRFQTHDVAVHQARLLYLLGDADRAGQLFAKAAGGLRTVDDVDAAIELADVQVRLGLRAAAREQTARYLTELARQTVNDRDPRRVLGAVFPKRGDEAWTWWTFFRQKFPQDDTNGTMKRVRDLLDPPLGPARTDPASFAEALVKAQVTDDAANVARGHEALAAAYEAVGQLGLARTELTHAAEKANDVARWLRLGDFLAVRNEPAAAATAFAKASELDPTAPLPLYLAGRALEKVGRVAEGQAQVERAHWLPLGNTELRGEVAAELAKRGHEDLARREREFVLKLGWAHAWSAGGLLSAVARDAAARQDFASAARYYERLVLQVLAEGRDFVESGGFLGIPALAYTYRARAELAAGRFDAARAAADRAQVLTPGNLDLALLLVPEMDRRGRKADADALYARTTGAYAALCREFPRSPFAHNACAWLGAGCRRDLDAALEHARTAVAAAPKSASFLDTLAEVHFQRGEQAKALELIHQCLTLDPKNVYLTKQLKRFEVGDRDAPVPPENDDD